MDLRECLAIYTRLDDRVGLSGVHLSFGCAAGAHDLAAARRSIDLSLHSSATLAIATTGLRAQSSWRSRWRLRSRRRGTVLPRGIRTASEVRSTMGVSVNVWALASVAVERGDAIRGARLAAAAARLMDDDGGSCEAHRGHDNVLAQPSPGSAQRTTNRRSPTEDASRSTLRSWKRWPNSATTKGCLRRDVRHRLVASPSLEPAGAEAFIGWLELAAIEVQPSGDFASTLPLVCGSIQAGRRERAASAVERKPAQLVAQPLVIEHELPDLVGQSVALPPALQATSRLALVFRRCRSRRPDRVGRGTQLVGRHMAHRGCLAGSVRGMPCCPTQVPGRGVRMAGRRAGLRPRDLASRPRTPELDRRVDGRPSVVPARSGAARAPRSPPPTAREDDDRRPGGSRLDER